MRWLDHLKTVNRHWRTVRKLCFRLGLYKQGLTHDLSKYSPTEFLVGAKYYQGYRSPNDAEREDKGYSSAWLHHKGRNRHHLEYWIDHGLEDGHKMVGIKIPEKYVAEMLCDRIAASKIYQGKSYTDASAYEYYEKSKSHYIIHRETAELLERLLIMVQEKGEDETFLYIRKNILKNLK